MNVNAERCVRAMISGRVQGVGYRYWLYQLAGKYGVTGWVRNRINGEVEAVICGEPEILKNVLAACRQGPTFAHVTDVQVEDSIYEQFENFDTRPTV